MAITSVDIDEDKLKQAKELAGTTPNRETVDLALRTLIAVRRQPSAVECATLTSYPMRIRNRT